MLACNVPLIRTSAQGRQEASLENPWIPEGAATNRDAQPPKKTLALRSSWPRWTDLGSEVNVVVIDVRYS